MCSRFFDTRLVRKEEEKRKLEEEEERTRIRKERERKLEEEGFINLNRKKEQPKMTDGFGTATTRNRFSYGKKATALKKIDILNEGDNPNSRSSSTTQHAPEPATSNSHPTLGQEVEEESEEDVFGFGKGIDEA